MKLRFGSYKRFPGNEEMEIRPITVIIGKNNSGKSSIMKLLVSFLRSIGGETPYPGLLLGEKDGFSLGSSFESICRNGNSVGLTVGMELGGNVDIEVALFKSPKGETAIGSYRISNGDKQIVARLDTASGAIIMEGGIPVTSPFKGIFNRQLADAVGLATIPAERVDYIGPLRIVPSRTLYMTNYKPLDSGVGYYGGNAYDMICTDSGLLEEVNKWFVANQEGCRLSVERGNEEGSFLIKIMRDENDDYGVNIADVGMGVNQVLPIVVSALNPDGPAVVEVEQPELHLHPAAHSSLATLMAESSARFSRRFVVETHSANFLLGLRDAVVDRNCKLSASDVAIYFIDEDEDGAYLNPISINPDGSLSTWPEGIFGESYELLKSIRRKAEENGTTR